MQYIANYLDFSQTTIFNELHRLNGEYHPRELMIDAHLAGLHLNHYQPLRNIKERIWTIDDPSTERKLLADHVAGIITDNFELANDVKKSVLV